MKYFLIFLAVYFLVGWAFIFFVRYMEYRSGNPMWLGHKLFGKDES